jgi:hypothetical protein
MANGISGTKRKKLVGDLLKLDILLLRAVSRDCIHDCTFIDAIESEMLSALSVRISKCGAKIITVPR